MQLQFSIRGAKCKKPNALKISILPLNQSATDEIPFLCLFSALLFLSKPNVFNFLNTLRSYLKIN